MHGFFHFSSAIRLVNRANYRSEVFVVSLVTIWLRDRPRAKRSKLRPAYFLICPNEESSYKLVCLSLSLQTYRNHRTLNERRYSLKSHSYFPLINRALNCNSLNWTGRNLKVKKEWLDNLGVFFRKYGWLLLRSL